MSMASLLLSAALAATVPTLPVEEYSLSNGLHVILSRDPELPLVAVEVRYLVGSANEREGRDGFAHLFEHLMFQGSASHDHEYFTPFTPLGADVNGSTSRDRTNYYERVPSTHLELALWMESDRMESFLPVLTQEKLDNQRNVVLNERRQNYEDEPYGMAWEYLAQALHPVGHPYRHTPIGSPEDLGKASLEDVRGFFTEYYVPANAVLTIVGDFEPTATRALVERYFGHIPSGVRATVPPTALPRVRELVHLSHPDDVELPRVHLVWVTPPLYAPGDAELDVLADVLSDGKGSRLFRPLVYEGKVAKDVSAYQASQRLSSMFVVQATAAPGVGVEQLHAELMKALRVALAEPPTEAELAAAVNGFKKSYYSQLEDVVERAGLLSNYYHHQGSADYLAQDFGRYTAATREGVFKVAKEWLDLERHVRLDIVPGAKPGVKP